MDILDDMGVSKLSAKDFFKVNYFFKSIIFVVTPSQWQSMRSDSQHQLPMFTRSSYRLYLHLNAIWIKRT